MKIGKTEDPPPPPPPSPPPKGKPPPGLVIRRGGAPSPSPRRPDPAPVPVAVAEAGRKKGGSTAPGPRWYRRSGPWNNSREASLRVAAIAKRLFPSPESEIGRYDDLMDWILGPPDTTGTPTFVEAPNRRYLLEFAFVHGIMGAANFPPPFVNRPGDRGGLVYVRGADYARLHDASNGPANWFNPIMRSPSGRYFPPVGPEYVLRPGDIIIYGSTGGAGIVVDAHKEGYFAIRASDEDEDDGAPSDPDDFSFEVRHYTTLTLPNVDAIIRYPL